MTSTPKFTVKTATVMLSGKLLFGNSDQIKARIFLEDIQKCVVALESCPHPDCDECDGDGECGYCGHECEECNATGRGRGCKCVDAWLGTSVYDEARKAYKAQKYARLMAARKSA